MLEFPAAADNYLRMISYLFIGWEYYKITNRPLKAVLR